MLQTIVLCITISKSDRSAILNDVIQKKLRTTKHLPWEPGSESQLTLSATMVTIALISMPAVKFTRRETC